MPPTKTLTGTIYVRELAYSSDEDYPYVAEFAPADPELYCWISTGSFEDPEEALERLAKSLKALGLVESLDDIDVEDETGTLYQDGGDALPETGDYVLAPASPLGSQTAVYTYDETSLGVYAGEDLAYDAIKRHASRNSVFPGVFVQDDHGGFTRIGFDYAAPRGEGRTS